MPADHRNSAIVVENLAKTFHIGFLRKRIDALKSASFEVPRGSVFGLVGPNGAGKTTTIKILTGLLRPTRGRAFIDGESVPSLASRLKLGYLPETPQFYDYLKPLEYLIFTGQLYGMSRSESRRRAGRLLDSVGLAGSERKAIRKFSKGMMQRLGIAQALIHEPDIVVLDEPQSGLDPMGRKEVKDLILNLKAQGRTVFLSSHILPDVEDVCDRIAVMVQGQVREVGSVADLLSAQLLITEMEVRQGSDPLPDALVDKLCQQAASHRRREGVVQLEFKGDVDTSALAAEVIRAGGQVIRLVPHRERLEDYFVRLATGSQEGPAEPASMLVGERPADSDSDEGADD